MKLSSTLTAAALSVLLFSCSAPKEVSYFQDSANGTENSIATDGRIRLRPDDKISIIVKSHEMNLTNLFNLPYFAQRIGTSSESIQNGSFTQGVAGYLISPEGCIEFPVLGKIKVAGMTRSELSEYIQDELKKGDLVNDPIVVVDYLNLYVSVLGEVTRPGRFAVDHDEYTILDAISAAGDLTISGLRKNVKVVRNENGKQHTYELNLCSAADIVNSPAYYLRQNDIVYVEPNKMKARQSTVNGNNILSTSFWISVSSLAVTVLLAINQFAK